jgi:hypothetical protein
MNGKEALAYVRKRFGEASSYGNHDDTKRCRARFEYWEKNDEGKRIMRHRFTGFLSPYSINAHDWLFRNRFKMLGGIGYWIRVSSCHNIKFIN